MYYHGSKMFLFLFFNLVFILDCYVSAKTYPSANRYDVNDLSEGLTTLSLLLVRKPNDIFTRLDEHMSRESQNSFRYKKYGTSKEVYKRTKLLSSDNNNKHRNRNMILPTNELNLQSRKKEKAWFPQLFDKQLTKRYANYGDVKSKKSIPQENQRKTKTAARLLMNNVSTKNSEYIQDDYIEDENDDYFKSINEEKMNWEEYENEDGASVMELLALNERHKSNTHSIYM